MTCGTIENIKNRLRKAVKGLVFCCVYFLVSVMVLYPTNAHAQIGTACDALLPTVEPDPGNNCDYLGLPICTITSTSTEIPPPSPQPRVNCADLIDMPLCSDIDGVIAERRNCVPECSTIGDSGVLGEVRGVDFAVHNKHCVRFCGPTLSDGTTNVESLASTLTDPANGKCVVRKCHQDVNGYTQSNNCELISCKLLTLDELNHPTEATNPKFSDSTKQFCDGSEKCYAFEQNKLEYLVSRQTNTMCTMHDCQPNPQPASDACYDDTKNIIDHVAGDAYITAYEEHIVGVDPTVENLATLNAANNNADVKEQLSRTCVTPTPDQDEESCVPLIKKSYYCELDEQISTTVRTGWNPSCDDDEALNPTDIETFSPNSTRCNDKGFCFKTIDCNKDEFAQELECVEPSSGSEGSSDTVNEEDSHSWFYRPRPLKKATNSNGLLHPRMDHNKLCYSKNDMDANGWGAHPKLKLPYFGEISLGYYHSQYNPDKTRSPGHCSASKDGYRGTGYLYLCGNEGNINAMVSNHTVYHKGAPVTTFTNTDTITSMKLCFRFKNAVRPTDITGGSETCGKRECAVSCAFGWCASQLCGFDVCRNVSIKQTESTKCQMDSDFFNDKNDKDCSTIVDDYLRLRVVQIANKVCTFLDVKGQFAYNNMFMKGGEKLSDGTCLMGTDIDGNCEGWNSNGEKGSADKWRALKHIPFIEADPEAGENGYWMADGQGGWKLVQAQECVKVKLRVRPPKLYNLANRENAFKLFRPPLYISETYVERDGDASSLTGELGKTDFNYPEIGITYGNTTYKLSLGLEKTGFETAEGDKDPKSFADIDTAVNGIAYDTKVFIRKEFNDTASTPTVCLYETVEDTTGLEQNIRLECVERELPQINGTVSAGSTRKVLISPPVSPANSYETASIDLAYQATIGSPAVTTTSEKINVASAAQGIPECSDDMESYEVCAQRDPCNMLTNECVNNEIAIQNAAHDADLSSYYGVRNYCQNTLSPLCSSKKDDLSGGATDYAYGWFNEICVTSGFNARLKDVLAHKVGDGVKKGKCVIDEIASSSGAVCADGGKPLEIGGTGEDCHCLEYVPDISYAAEDYVVRKQTPREAGLCLDLPMPEMCYALDYDNDTDVSACAGDATCIENTINAARTAGTATGNADFLTDAFSGMNKVEGQCKGNWTYAKDSVTGLSLSPTINCGTSGTASTASWLELSVNNPCVRYSCPEIDTKPVPTVMGSAAVISYTGNYTISSENSATQGQSNGYATWNTQTSGDVNQQVTADECITGFEATGGNLPTRSCSPKGVWQAVSNSCSRMECSALNSMSTSSHMAYGDSGWDGVWSGSAINPLNSSLSASAVDEAWLGWHTYGGATFPAAKASRFYLANERNDVVATDSISTGVCNEELGYFQAPGGSAPTMKCNSLGQWVALENACVTTCAQVDVITSTDANSGNAFWEEGVIADDQDSVAGEFDGCRTDSTTGYAYKPYAYGLLDDATVSETQTEPTRLCENHNIVDGNTGTYIRAAYWSVATPACVNKCPGNETDDRIGAGRTTHTLSDGTVITLSWDDANPGDEQIRHGTNSGDVSDYGSSSDSSYAVKRTCGGFDASGELTDIADDMVVYKWITYRSGTETVKPLCSAYQGTAGTSNENIPNTNAIFGDDDVDNYVEESNTISAATCISGYDRESSSHHFPEFECKAKDTHRYIDEFYYQNYHEDATDDYLCLRTCEKPVNNHIYGSGSQYKSEDNPDAIFAGDSLVLRCRTGFGHALDTVATNGDGSDDSCGRDVEERTSLAPTKTCRSDGTWSAVINPCSTCRSCDNESSLIGNVTTNPTYGCNDNYEGTAQEIMAECDNNEFTTSYDVTQIICHEHKETCGNTGRWVNANIFMTCLDGAYRYDSWTHRNDFGNCEPNATRCGLTIQGKTVIGNY